MRADHEHVSLIGHFSVFLLLTYGLGKCPLVGSTVNKYIPSFILFFWYFAILHRTCQITKTDDWVIIELVHLTCSGTCDIIIIYHLDSFSFFHRCCHLYPCSGDFRRWHISLGSPGEFQWRRCLSVGGRLRLKRLSSDPQKKYRDAERRFNDQHDAACDLTIFVGGHSLA